MWIITPRGFFSAVNDPDKRRTVKVRARVREDLETLCELRPMRRYADKIVVTPYNDYACRIFVKKRHWNRALKLLGKEVTYENHKDEVKARQGQERANIYMNVWSDLYELQAPRWEDEPVWPKGYPSRPDGDPEDAGWRKLGELTELGYATDGEDEEFLITNPSGEVWIEPEDSEADDGPVR